MRKLLILLLPAVVALPGAAAPDADPLRSPACTQALQALQAARASGDPAAEALRQAAARACLGLSGPPQRLGRPIEPPTVVPPPAIEPPPQRPARFGPPPSPLPPPVAIERPSVVTGCDPNGCWADDGTRPQRVGPQPLGPRGPCTVQAGVLPCP
jgi:hypothetical protein